jgi:Tfp pilus assembly protein PilX
MNLRNRLSDERGWALITAILLMTIMLSTIFGVASFVDGQTREGAVTRTRETAFNIAEAALNAQIFALSQDWPGQGNAATPYPTCTPASTGTRCPNSSALAKLIASPDATGATWQTVVRDDGTDSSQNFYSDSTTLSKPAYDQYGNGRLWVRATATARGKTRTLVTLVRVEEQSEDVPHAAVIANRVNNSNNGNKTIEDLSNSTGANGFIGVRCTPTNGESQACLGQPWSGGTFPDSRVTTQINPYDGHIQTGYTSAPIMSAAARARLKARAIADGTYYATCPASLPATADVVWIENAGVSTCSFVGNGTSQAAMLIVNTGTIEFSGNNDFKGVVYAVNSSSLTGNVVTVHGNGQVRGGILVDGPGVVDVGSSKSNLVFDDTAYNAVKSYGTAGIIQNTWREIRG